MKIRNRIAISTLSLISLGLAIFGVRFNRQSVTKVSAYTNGDAATYYNSIGQYDSGTTLLNKLNTLNNTKRRTLIDYYDLTTYFPQTDPGVSDSTVTTFYSGELSYKRSVNREHVWPFSRLYGSSERGDADIEKDLQMVRPILSDINTARGNSFFVEGMQSDINGWDPGTYPYTSESYRGDIARIIFYSAIADLHLTLVDTATDISSNHTMGKLSHLLDWNLRYPVLDRENVRNEATESIQGHRNPFIDHPEYACRIWGNYNNETRRVCSSSGFSGTLAVNSGSTQINDYVIEEEQVTSFTASINSYNGAATYDWSISDIYGNVTTSDTLEITSKSGNSVTVTGLAIGSSYLKASATVTLGNGETETLWKTVKINTTKANRLSGLRVVTLPNKTTYNVGDTFNPNGLMVVATYSDYSEENVTDRIVYGDTTLDSPGRKRISVSYTYKGLTLSTSFVVNVHSLDPEPTPSKKSGCGGNIITTSVILSTLALLGVSLLLVNKYKRK